MNTAAPQTASAVPSPCVNICRMSEATGLCQGCWRSIDEISAWSRLPDEAKSEVCRLIAERKNRAAPHPEQTTIQGLAPDPSLARA